MKSQSRTSGEHETVGILYCHGWGSLPTRARTRSAPLPSHARLMASQSITPLASAGGLRDVCSTAEAVEALVIGTSLGGYAAWLGAEFDRPFIAINPAIAPSTTLRAYIGHGVNHVELFELTQDCVKAYNALAFAWMDREP